MEQNVPQDLTFEAAMDRLEKIVRQMQGNEIPLEEAMALFQEGTDLARLCNAMLDQAQMQVTLVTTGPDGQLEEREFAEDAE